VRTTPARWTKLLARAGFACRGLVYLLLGALTLEVAGGRRGSQPDDRGAFQVIAHQPLGRVLLLAVVAGFACLALWEASGAARRSRPPGRRLAQAGKAVVYLGLAGSALAVVASAPGASSDQQVVDVTARVMTAPGGRLLAGAAGAAIAAGGLYLLAGGLRRAGESEIDLSEASPGTRRVIEAVGVAGMTARGAVFGLTGYFLIEAAVTFDAARAKGLDGVLRSIAGAPYGPWVLAAVALGFAAFGSFSLLEARYARA
jgi:hypothetical protein